MMGEKDENLRQVFITSDGQGEDIKAIVNGKDIKYILRIE
jgi:hypothetical protein